MPNIGIAWNNTKLATLMYLCKYTETHNQAFLRQSQQLTEMMQRNTE